MAYKSILKAIPTLQATALVSENVKLVKKPKKDTGSLLKQGVKNILGIKLTTLTADSI